MTPARYLHCMLPPASTGTPPPGSAPQVAASPFKVKPLRVNFHNLRAKSSTFPGSTGTRSVGAS
jgi:hypothetical protein